MFFVEFVEVQLQRYDRGEICDREFLKLVEERFKSYNKQMATDKCDLCGIDLPAGSYCPPPFEKNGHKFRLDVQILAGNGCQPRLWKSACFCKYCYNKQTRGDVKTQIR